MERADADGAIPQSLNAGQEKASTGRRKHERFAIDCKARVHAIELSGARLIEKAGIAITAHNWSRTGLGFLSRQPLNESQYVRVYLLGTGTLANRIFEVQVVHCRNFSDGWHEVGVRFAS